MWFIVTIVTKKMILHAMSLLTLCMWLKCGTSSLKKRNSHLSSFVRQSAPGGRGTAGRDNAEKEIRNWNSSLRGS